MSELVPVASDAASHFHVALRTGGRGKGHGESLYSGGMRLPGMSFDIWK